MEDGRCSALPYIHGAVGNVGGAHVDRCIAEMFSACESERTGQAYRVKASVPMPTIIELEL